MSNNRDLLKEAIADAKAVKETAIANAKLALEEAFTPHLKSMLSAKLEEMDEIEEDIDEGYGKMYDEDDVKKEEMDSMKSEEDDMKKEEMKKYSEDDIKKEEMKKYSEDDKIKKEEIDESEEVSEAEEVEEEINLDELLAELDEEMKDKKVKKEEMEDKPSKVKKMEESEDLSEAEEIEESEEVNESEEIEESEEVAEQEEMEGEMEDEEIDLEDMTEDDLKSFIEDVIKDMVEAGELEAGDEMEMDDDESEMDMDIEVEDEVEPMMEKEEKLEEMDEVSFNEKNNPTRNKAVGERDPKKVGKSTAAYAINEEEVSKILNEVEELKKELQEVNLLNAKLLYTNKIFKSKNLSEDKKVKVLKAFDKAATVKEAKVIFETLNEGISSKMTKPSINEVKGSASKATGVVPKAKQPIVENAAFARMQKLAGIIKN